MQNKNEVTQTVTISRIEIQPGTNRMLVGAFLLGLFIIGWAILITPDDIQALRVKASPISDWAGH